MKVYKLILISSTTFGEKLHFTTANHKRKYKFIMGFNLFLMTVNNYLKLSPRKILFNPFYSTKWCKKLFKFISGTNFLEGHHIFNQERFDGYICSVWYTTIHFSLPLNPVAHRMGNAPKILCPRCREQKQSQTHLFSSSPKLL